MQQSPAFGAEPRTTIGRRACGGRKGVRDPCGAPGRRAAASGPAWGAARRHSRPVCGWLPGERRLRSSSSGWFGTSRRRRWEPARYGARGRNRPGGPGGAGSAKVWCLPIPDGRSRKRDRPVWGIPRCGQRACSAGRGAPARRACGRSYPGDPRSEAGAGRTESPMSRLRGAATGAVPLWSQAGRRGPKFGTGRGRP